MSEQEMIKFLLNTAIPIVVAIIAVYKGITEPVNKLREEFVEYRVGLREATRHNEIQDTRITEHGKEIEINTLKIEKQDVLIENHETRISKLEDKKCRYEESKYYKEV